MKIKNQNIIISSNSETKKQLFHELSILAKKIGVVTSIKKLEEGFWAREKEGSTGMEFGFAIPHAKIDEITKPTILVIKTKKPIKNYETFDGSKVQNIIALLIPKKNVKKDHIKILSKVALLLTKENFRHSILSSKTKKNIVDVFHNCDFDGEKERQNVKEEKKSLKIVGITSCAAGVAHTFISAENLIKAGEKLGYSVRIETQGATGSETPLSEKEIAEADYVVIASDISVEADRFNNKKVYRTSVSHAVKDSIDVINKTIQLSKMQKTQTRLGESDTSNAQVPKRGRLFMQAIMTGVSWMIPLLVACAVLLAIPNIAGAFAGKSSVVSQGNWKEYVSNGLDNAWWRFMYVTMRIGWSSISLMFPIFAGFSAMAIGNKPAFVPGLVGGFLAKPSMFFGNFSDTAFPAGSYPFMDKTSGFWGALIIGLLVGYVIKYSNKYIKVPRIMNAIKPMLILPFIGIAFTMTTMILMINPAFGFLNEQLIHLAKSSGKSGKYALAFLIAPMTAFDLGGPINKAAVTVVNSFRDSKVISLTMRVIPTITPSIGLGLAAIMDRFIVHRRVFDVELRKAAPNSIILALLGISEGGLPFVFKNPLLTIPVNMIGGLMGSLVGIMTNTEQWFPDSAIWAWPFAQPVWGLLLGILVGSVSTMLMHIFLRWFLIKLGYLKVNAEPVQKIRMKEIKNSLLRIKNKVMRRRK